VCPQGAFWSASQSLLRWQLGSVTQGASGAMVVAFRVSSKGGGGGAEVAAAGLARCHALLKLQGEGELLVGCRLAGWGCWLGLSVCARRPH
jgi:hypothetical protein